MPRPCSRPAWTGWSIAHGCCAAASPIRSPAGIPRATSRHGCARRSRAASATAAVSPAWWSTWIASSRSTTGTGSRPATSRCGKSPLASSRRCAQAMPLPASAATSSASCCRRLTGARPCRWPSGFSPPCRATRSCRRWHRSAAHGLDGDRLVRAGPRRGSQGAGGPARGRRDRRSAPCEGARRREVRDRCWNPRLGLALPGHQQQEDRDADDRGKRAHRQLPRRNQHA